MRSLRSFAPRTQFATSKLNRTLSNTTSFRRFTSSTASAMSAPSTNSETTEDQTQEKKTTLALPDAESATKIDVSSGSGSARFDALGPMVVNVDGTLARITNWEQMSAIEQKNTLRILAKRNKERLEALKGEEVEK